MEEPNLINDKPKMRIFVNVPSIHFKFVISVYKQASAMEFKQLIENTIMTYSSFKNGEIEDILFRGYKILNNQIIGEVLESNEEVIVSLEDFDNNEYYKEKTKYNNNKFNKHKQYENNDQFLGYKKERDNKIKSLPSDNSSIKQQTGQSHQSTYQFKKLHVEDKKKTTPTNNSHSNINNVNKTNNSIKSTNNNSNNNVYNTVDNKADNNENSKQNQNKTTNENGNSRERKHSIDIKDLNLENSDDDVVPKIFKTKKH